MADDEGDSEMFDISTLSEAERRRLRRRQRILDNQGARLQRILSSDPNNPVAAKEGSSGSVERSEPEPASTSSSRSDSSEPVFNRGGGVDTIDGDNEEGETKVVKDKVSKNVTPIDSATQSHSRQHQASGNVGRIAASLLQELSGSGERTPTIRNTTREQAPNVESARMGVQSDGTVILPKISNFYGRILICLLALFLSIMNAKRCLITFISWEVAFYFLNGLPPLPPPDMMMVLAAVVGLQENQLIRVKKILHFGNCVLIDFSLFLTFTLMPHFIRQVMKSF